MARQLEIRAWDDLDLAEGTKTPATEVRLMQVGQRQVELDLSADHADQFDKAMAYWLDAGHRPDPSTRPKQHRAAGAAKTVLAPSGRKISEQTALWRGYAGQVNFDYTTGHKGSKPYYPIWLRREAQAWLDAGRPQDWQSDHLGASHGDQ